MSFELRLSHLIGEHKLEVDCSSEAKLTAIVGPSGIGKTTLINLVAGIRRPDSGRIAVDGVTLFDSETGLDLPPEQRRAGYVFQDNRLFPHMRVGANLAYGERLSRPEDRWTNQAEVLAFLGIRHLIERWPANLSGGEARRVAIGRALLSAPRFLLLDEPLTSLDVERAEEILQVVERIRDELKLPILYVSHSRSEVERLTDSIIRLS
jgi:molybdate transport system ATP-binding protein